jgi:hypothetical protein
LKQMLAVSSLAFAILFTAAPALTAQNNLAASAPVPSQILDAKKVFVANTSGGIASGMWSGGPNRIYNEFYAALKSGGRFELVPSPGNADLVVDVDVIANSADWQLHLEILDPKTGIVLWAVYEPVKFTMSKETREKNLDDTINKLAVDLSGLTAR